MELISVVHVISESSLHSPWLLDMRKLDKQSVVWVIILQVSYKHFYITCTANTHTSLTSRTGMGISRPRVPQSCMFSDISMKMSLSGRTLMWPFGPQDISAPLKVQPLLSTTQTTQKPSVSILVNPHRGPCLSLDGRRLTWTMLHKTDAEICEISNYQLMNNEGCKQHLPIMFAYFSGASQHVILKWADISSVLNYIKG